MHSKFTRNLSSQNYGGIIHTCSYFKKEKKKSLRWTAGMRKLKVEFYQQERFVCLNAQTKLVLTNAYHNKKLRFTCIQVANITHLLPKSQREARALLLGIPAASACGSSFQSSCHKIGLDSSHELDHPRILRLLFVQQCR